MEKLSSLKFSVLTGMVILAAEISASDWSKSMAEALATRKSDRIAELLRQKQSSGAVLQDFIEVVRDLQSRSGYSLEYGRLVELFHGTLAKDHSDGSLDSFIGDIQDPQVPLEAKSILLRVMIKGDKELSSAGKEKQFEAFSSMVHSENVPVELRAQLLRKLGSHPRVTDHKFFLEFTASTDTLLRSSAYRGLGQMVRSNRLSNRTQENRAIFNDLRPQLGAKLELDAIRALAQISEDYAREFLLSKCAGNPDEIKTILFHDANMEHEGIIKESVRHLKDRNNRESVENALRYGVKSQEKVIDNLLFGGDEEILVGLKLLKIFHNQVKKHEDFIHNQFKNPDEEIRLAALALVPHFTNRKMALARSMEELKSDPEKRELHKELTWSLGRD